MQLNWTVGAFKASSRPPLGPRARVSYSGVESDVLMEKLGSVAAAVST